jgi:tetratricopeptide (TPR) repeat protein
MRLFLKSLVFSTLLCNGYITNCFSQLNDPEAIKMQENAKKDMDRGNYSNAILLYNQAIKLEPNDVGLRRDLAYAHYMNGTVDKGKAIISEVLKTDYADELTYQVAAAIESKSGSNNKAKNILNTGLKKYPNSALLYYNLGNLLSLEGKEKQSLQHFINGIKADPNYASNYFALAKYYEKNNPLWSILYYETFVNLEPYTKKTAEAKTNLYKSYIAYFQKTNISALPSFGNTNNKTNFNNFEAVVKNLIDNNVAAISNGINTESLAMLRTRIILEWNLNYADRFPYSLFSYHDKLLKNGHFEAYNQWLFGANENSTAFSNWIKTNNKEYNNFENWFEINILQPTISDPKSF